MKKTVSITTSSNLPTNFIDEFEEQLNLHGIDVDKNQLSEDEYYNFSGSDLINVLIAIKENAEAIFLFPALYDITKATVIGLWNKLTKTENVDQKNKKLVIKYTDSKNRNFKIKMEGDIDSNIVEKIVEKSFEQLKADKEEMYQNPDLLTLDDDGIETIEMVFNPKTNSYEPINFGEMRRQMEEFQKRAEENF